MNRETQQTKLEQLAALVEGMKEVLRGMQHWRNGNGSKGAEQRLQDVEANIEYLKGCSVTKDDLSDFASEWRQTLRHIQTLWWAGIGILVVLTILSPIVARLWETAS